MVQERPVRVERRLSAILAADVAGYSRLMHIDEEATHAKLTALLADAVVPSIAEHGGRIVKNTGDGFLAEFTSSVEAVRAAVQFQTRIKELTINEEEDRRIAFRVGINVGDVIVEPYDIFGDGVNIAARLEGIAEPGGICISSFAYDQVWGKIGVEFADLGDQNLKNIARPVRAYAVARVKFGPTIKGSGTTPIPHPAPRLSIVVLPFANLSGDREQDYFADGITESLTTDLSRIGGSFVMAQDSAVSYKGRAVDVRQVGRELNVRYVLEGSVQRSGKRLRMNVQLIDARSGQHLWAERFEKPFGDLFDMQDEIVSRLAGTLGAQLIEAEARRAERTLHPDAMDLCFQGRAWLMKGISLECVTQARGFFERSLEFDPGNVEAMIGLANVDTVVGGSFTTDDGPARLAAAEAMVNKVLSIRPNSASAHMARGWVQTFTNRAAQGIREFEHALALAPNLVNAHAALGFAKSYIGRATETEGHVLEALRLSPRDVFAYQWACFAGVAKLLLGSDVEAVSWLRRSTEANRNFHLAHISLAAALALTGALDEARTAARTGLALNSGFTIRRLLAAQQSDNPIYLAGLQRLCEGWRLASVPEG
ncbi:adenylate/guanylate cyclase domain-containing protein [Bradyrhizobium arachidis]|uniref:Adenylate/guanylate cyclase domain-containing protein n=1 Tax=Bradyrhizobium arachidis TaxID=858423 RepID=A0AAE7TI98_9BRAD|nr:adenylate/guanylate cyclase domain-containing protein [Bradyrhizobium arachidis]QOZ69325.1 adenylate/guanylate cyclase domain-containing protein [Bradyrhizobium arachidis]SFV11878.1 TolB amino-terminal domain-containing protein [Bradyrhizobium arachidis]